ncbi:hypothetical protein CPLU01_10641 [Colletotrichum plurivorum]|uniref:Uncharacterized protein n=1 Tax=Colletotrichum plurivorum TaxID=2175906 RepID=A0A8H6N903_9PEZI|nr:hypothetical protein CPLU01_10641 [Colletotrichum plurivorum]
MNMMDENGFDHHLFCLPKRERPKDEAKGSHPITLSAILDPGKHDRTRKSGRDTDGLWIMQLSRLIAEAVLRFDLKSSDGSMVNSIVFYKSSKHDLTPFLEVVIKKSDLTPNVIEDERYVSQQRSGRLLRLLDLGEILLQLGLYRQERLLKFPLDTEDRRSFLREKAPDVCRNMNIAYSSVIESCIRLSVMWEDPSYLEEAFKETYYESIVKPLREMEKSLFKTCNRS